jgi:hypothetical protein
MPIAHLGGGGWGEGGSGGGGDGGLGDGGLGGLGGGEQGNEPANVHTAERLVLLHATGPQPLSRSQQLAWYRLALARCAASDSFPVNLHQRRLEKAAVHSNVPSAAQRPSAPDHQ